MIYTNAVFINNGYTFLVLYGLVYTLDTNSKPVLDIPIALL